MYTQTQPSRTKAQLRRIFWFISNCCSNIMVLINMTILPWIFICPVFVTNVVILWDFTDDYCARMKTNIQELTFWRYIYRCEVVQIGCHIFERFFRLQQRHGNCNFQQVIAPDLICEPACLSLIQSLEMEVWMTPC